MFTCSGTQIKLTMAEHERDDVLLLQDDNDVLDTNLDLADESAYDKWSDIDSLSVVNKKGDTRKTRASTLNKLSDNSSGRVIKGTAIMNNNKASKAVKRKVKY